MKCTIRVELEIEASKDISEGFAIESANWVRKGMAKMSGPAYSDWAKYEVKVGKVRF